MRQLCEVKRRRVQISPSPLVKQVQRCACFFICKIKQNSSDGGVFLFVKKGAIALFRKFDIIFKNRIDIL